MNTGLVIGALVFWLAAWAGNEVLVRRYPHAQTVRLFVPLLFGVTLLVLWQGLTVGLGVPKVLLPPPSDIAARFAASVPTLWVDFLQTFKAVLAGYAIGCLSGFAVAILVDRSPFLKRGLLPIGNFVSALPIIGIAPIMVMWFGFDWPSKAAVVVAMTFFPMLVNTVAGLNAASMIERDLMRTYASSWFSTLWRPPLPAAAPFMLCARAPTRTASALWTAASSSSSSGGLSSPSSSASSPSGQVPHYAGSSPRSPSPGWRTGSGSRTPRSP